MCVATVRYNGLLTFMMPRSSSIVLDRLQAFGADKAGEALEAINTAMATITMMTTQIAGAAEQQNAVTEEIRRNINSIKDVAQQTAEGAAATASGSEELVGLARQFQSLVQQSKL